jgi:hypothetical protein
LRLVDEKKKRQPHLTGGAAKTAKLSMEVAAEA